ncbi:hypothetical protein HU200_032577 [Digitaria exilis]|uniref:MIF4G domain-containing protein n=1 Tax=Digitaria exilis TaxID=1010633 RepID=A0A835BMR2_9POAL|nr:hypothetical protein HU200_032577 [Digitaria exilis]
MRALDSSIKHITTVIKKLKMINDEVKDGLIEELKTVNLSKFVSEAVYYICTAKLRSTDIEAAVQICSLLHQRYTDFSPCLIQGLLKIFYSGMPEELNLDNNARAMKKRSTLKLLMELYFVGIFEDVSTFTTIIKDLTSLEHLKDREATQTNLSLLASFARQGKLFLGLQQYEQDAYDEFFMGLNITSDQKRFFKKTFCSYYDAASGLLLSEHASLRVMESENAKILNDKGELSDENTALYEKLRRSFDQLLHSVSSLAEALDMQPPVMPEDGHTTRVTTGTDVTPGKEFSVVQHIWDDEDTKAFYESLPDLRTFVPAVLLGEAKPKLEEQHGIHKQSDEFTIPSKTEVSDNCENSIPDHQYDAKANDEPKNTMNTKKETVDKETFEEKLDGRKGDTEIDKDQIKIETKIRNIRFIGELCKFKIAPSCLVFSCLKYIWRLLFKDLDKSTVQHVLLQLLKLPWAECEQYLVKCFLKVHKGKYSQVHLIALLTAGLSHYHHDFAVTVVDEVLEEIRVGLELNNYAMQQQRLAHMRFLGELYNYEYIDSSVVFETLYLLISFGHGTPEIWNSEFAAPQRKLDRFLLFFQRYALRKGPLPLDVEFDVQDMFADLRPNMTRHSSIEGLNDALIQLEENERVITAEKCEHERHSDSESQLKQSEDAAFDANGKRAENRPKKNVKDHDEVAESENSFDSRSRYLNAHEDGEHFPYEERSEDRLENERHSDGTDAPVGSDEEETADVQRTVVQVDPDQEDFDRELKAILQESLKSRKLEMARPTANMTIPMNAFEGSKDLMATEAADKENVCGEIGQPGDLGDVRVKVLVKKGHKQQAKQMLIPGDCPLVQNTRQQGAAELEEMQNIKQKILEYNEREEEELGRVSVHSGDWGQGGSGNMPLAGSPGHVSWNGRNRGGGVRRHYWVAGGFYRGYGRR